MARGRSRLETQLAQPGLQALHALALLVDLVGALAAGRADDALLVAPAQPIPRVPLVRPLPQGQAEMDVGEPGFREWLVSLPCADKRPQHAALQEIVRVEDHVVGDSDPRVLPLVES